jgi:hypothetical protein
MVHEGMGEEETSKFKLSSSTGLKMMGLERGNEEN